MQGLRIVLISRSVVLFCAITVGVHVIYRCRVHLHTCAHHCIDGSRIQFLSRHTLFIGLLGIIIAA